MWGRITAGVLGGGVAAVLLGGLAARAVGDPKQALSMGGMIAVLAWAILMVAGLSRRSGRAAWLQLGGLSAAALLALWWTA